MHPAVHRFAQSGLLGAVAMLAILWLTPACASQTAYRQLPTVQAAEPIITPPLPAISATPSPSVTPAPASTRTPEPTAVPTELPSPTPTLGCDQPGQVVTGRFPSALAWPDLAYRIYLPPCYGQDGHVYPVLYMLPGNVHDDSIWDQLGLDEAAEAGIQNELIPPLLIVMPEGGQIDSQTSGGPYSFEGVILSELVPFVESNYCAWSDSAGRAIGGLSRGGYWALEIAFRNPAAFASAGGHGAALVDSYAGPAIDPIYTASSADLSGLRIYLDAGSSDWYLPHLQVLHNNLLAAGRDHVWRIQDGGHDNAYWAAHVADYLEWYSEPWSADRDEYPPCLAGNG
ncbi:MAG: hypothetical protein JSW55_13465 [Chloroflexota bacterium]|nr:MAG: hypothetical protein JSW55_13465 [Chloroflexota bacterium]